MTLSLLIILLANPSSQECSKRCLICNKDQANPKCYFCDYLQNYTLKQNTDTCIRMHFSQCLKYSHQGVCIKCEKNYYIENGLCVESKQIIENCLVYKSNGCFECIEGYAFYGTKCNKVAQPIEACVRYKMGDPTDCEQCESTHLLTRNKKHCITKPVHKNCQNYSSVRCNKCKSDYDINKNFYFHDFNSEKLAGQNAKILMERYINQDSDYPLKTCQSISAHNCKVFSEFNKCSECKEGYFLDVVKNQCIQFPQDAIRNCKQYKSPTQCLECENEYFLKNQGECKAVENVNFCTTYSGTASITQCLRCQEEKKLEDVLCVPRKVVSECLKHNAIEEECDSCNKGFELTTDRKLCLKEISECKDYEPSTLIQSELSCLQCIKSKTFDTTSKVCVNGSVQNCNIYLQNNQCKECVGGYYLKKGKCDQNNHTVENCKKDEIDQIDTCQTCELHHDLFKKQNECQEASKIENCVEYSKKNRCKRCSQDFMIEVVNINGFINKCVPIVKSRNCHELSNGKCVYCNDGFILVSGVCKKVNDTVEFLCQKHNNNQKIEKEQFKCLQCQTKSVPLKMKSAFLCTHIDNIKQISNAHKANCIQYMKTDSSTYQCQSCSEGFFLQDGECKTNCGTKQIVLQSILKKRQSDVSSKYSSYKIDKKMFCGDVLSSNNGNCYKAAVNTFFQNEEAGMQNYVCVECSQNAFNIIQIGQTTNLYSPNLEESMIQGPLLAYPGLDCQTVKDKIKSTKKENDLVPNCEFYYNLSGNSDNYFGCIKCQQGFTGRIVKATDIQNSYIEKCVTMSSSSNVQDNEDPKSGECDTAVFYQGYTQIFDEVAWNRAPLESFLSCHKCISPDHYPFLFINFEDMYFYQSGTGYSPNENKMTKHVVLDRYWTPSSLQKDKADGYSMRCLKAETSNFYNNTNLTLTFKDIINTFKGETENCALFIVNTLRYTYAQKLHPKSQMFKGSIYCAACKPGYRAVISKKYFTQDQDGHNYHVPYMVSNCVKILECATKPTHTYVNSCQECKDQQVWSWNQTNKYIEYDKCQYNQIHNCLASNTTNSCKVCKRGYEYVHNQCELFKPSFCNDEFNVFQQDFPADPQFVALGRNYMALRNFGDGCLNCRQGYVSLNDQKDPNSNNFQAICTISTNLTKAQTINETNQLLIQHCKNYGLNEKKIVRCKVCEKGYAINENEKCTFSSIQNCQKITTNTGSQVCQVCSSEYVIVKNFCKLKNIDNCIKYYQDSNLSVQKCLHCQEGFYPLDSKCMQGQIEDCKSYDKQTVCKTCNDGYVLTKMKSTLCIKIPEDLKCKVLKEEDFNNRQITCDVCNAGFYQTKSLAKSSSYCITIPKVDQCVQYDINLESLIEGSYKCLKCHWKYYLDQGKNRCLNRQPDNIPPNCNKLHQHEDRCIKCKPKFYLSSQRCVSNPVGIAGCRIYETGNKCKSCNKDYFLESAQCKPVPEKFLVENCIYYHKENDSTVCTQCVGTHYIDNNICHVSNANNCLLAKEAECEICMPGCGKKPMGFLVHCEPYPEKNCLELVEDKYPFDCKRCKPEYYPIEQRCVERQGDDIENCIYYQSELECQACKSGFILEIDKSSCIQITSVYSRYEDENCEELELQATPDCAMCSKGYFFSKTRNEKGELNQNSVDTCQECKGQGLGQGCALCDYQNQNKCMICNSKFFMQKDGSCQNFNEDTGTDGTNTQSVTTSNGVVLSRIGVMLLLLGVVI